MGVSETRMISYECDHDECDTVRTAAPGKAPKGILFRVDPLTLGTLNADGRVMDGMDEAGDGYSCSQQHVGRALAAVIAKVAATMDGAKGAAQDEDEREAEREIAEPLDVAAGDDETHEVGEFGESLVPANAGSTG